MSLAIVQAARAKYAHLSGPERAYRIVNQVAWDLRHQGAGTFHKVSGTQYAHRSLDILIFHPGGETYDILTDADGRAEPKWERTLPTGFGDLANWRAPFRPEPVDEPKPQPQPEPTPPPTPKPKGITYLEWLDAATAIADHYRAKHHRDPAASDIAHNLWRLGSARWPTLADVLRDI